MNDMERLSLNTATIKKSSLAEAVELCSAAGLGHIGLWRDRVAEAGLEKSAKLVADAGLQVSSLCRGGFLTAADDGGQRHAYEDNVQAIIEAATLGTSELIMVVGGMADGERDIAAARGRVADRLAELAPVAEEHGVRLVLEALHPMYAADRAVLSTLGQALELAAPFPARTVGVVVDTFHVWWDPQLEQQIRAAGEQGRLASYQVCDWNLPIASDALLSRGYMGDGYIDFTTISQWVSQTGYSGPVEVEIFNQQIWDSPPADVVDTVKNRYRKLVLPHL